MAIEIDALEARRHFSQSAGVLTGVGAMGDSFTDEYQFYPPDRSTAKNYVELLATDRGLNFGSFSTTPRKQPRGAGYEFDWGLDGATSTQLIKGGQAKGLAAQAKKGQVTTALLFTGGDDYLDAFTAKDPAKALAKAGPTLMANIKTAIQTVARANANVKVVVATLPPVSDLPVVVAEETAGALPAALVDAAVQSEEAVNTFIRSYVAAHANRVALADFESLAGNLISGPTSVVGGVKINTTTVGDDPHDLYLADGIHIGTVGQAELANLFIGAMDTAFGANIAPFSDQEILAAAGLGG